MLVNRNCPSIISQLINCPNIITQFYQLSIIINQLAILSTDWSTVQLITTLLPLSQDIDFAEFTLHLSLGILPCMVVAYAVLGCIYCTYVKLPNKDPPHIAEMKREIAIWERTASQMPVVSLEETAVRDALMTKANEVRMQLQQEVVMR